ncbi:hypothetical protein HDU67_009496, partial [Dinochytrium kinnereticum]
MLLLPSSAVFLFSVFALTAHPSLAQFKCDKVQQGAFCFSDCKGSGIYISSPTPLVRSITLPNFSLEFNPSDPWNPKATASNVKAALDIPPALKDIKMSFTNAGATINVATQQNTPPVASLKTPDSSPASGDSISGNLLMALDGVPMAVTNNDRSGFQRLFEKVTVQSGDVPLIMEGYASTRTVAVNAALLQSLARRDDSDQALFLRHILKKRQSPSDSIEPGVNSLTATGYVLPDPGNEGVVKATRELLSRFTGGRESEVVVAGGRSSGMPSLDLAFAAVRLKQVLPASKVQLIQLSNFAFPTNLLSFPLTTKANIIATNPFDAPVSITYLRASLIFDNTTIGTIDQPVQNFELGPRASATSPAF